MKILVGFDGSEASKAALKLAAELVAIASSNPPAKVNLALQQTRG